MVKTYVRCYGIHDVYIRVNCDQPVKHYIDNTWINKIRFLTQYKGIPEGETLRINRNEYELSTIQRT